MSLIRRLFAPPRPTVAVEIASRAVSALRLTAGSPPTVGGYAVEPLAEGAVVPALGAPNIADPAVVTEAIRRVLAAVGGSRDVALVVPDSVAKVSLVRFDQVPARAGDFEAMLRWNVRKSLPFKSEDAQITSSAGATLTGAAREFVVAAGRRDIIEEYEGVCAAAGAHAGVVDLATFNVLNLLLSSSPAGDWLLVHLAFEYASIAIVREGDMIFYRHRGADGDESLADLVHQTAMYYEDRLAGKGFGRVVLAGAGYGPEGPAGAGRLRQALADRLGAAVEPVDLRGAATLGDRLRTSPDIVEQMAPLVGILVREPAA